MSNTWPFTYSRAPTAGRNLSYIRNNEIVDNPCVKREVDARGGLYG